MFKNNYIVNIGILMLCAFFGLCHQAPAQQMSAQKVQKVIFPKSPDHLLISYAIHHEMLATNDPIPLLQIFGDGRVLVHRPDHLKQAGDYEMFFSQKELQDLALALIEQQIMSFTEESVQQQIEQADLDSGSRAQVSDNSRISLVFNVHGVKIRGQKRIHPVGKRLHRLDKIGPMARFYPTIKSVGDMAEIEKALYSLVYSSRLTPVP